MITKEKFKTNLKLIFTNKVFICSLILTFVYFLSGFYKWIEIGVPLLAFFMFIFLPVQGAFCLFAYLHFFALSNIGYYSCLMATLICFLLVFLVKYLIGVKHKKYPIYKAILILILLFNIFTIIVSLFYKTYVGGLIYLTYLPLFYLIFAMRKEFDINQIMAWFLLGLVVSCCMAAVVNIIPHYQYVTFPHNRFTGFINCANYLYMRALLILTFYMYKFLNNSLSGIKFLAIYFVCALITLSTISKTAIVLLVFFTLLFCILFVGQNFKKRVKYLFVFALLLVVTALICHNLLISVYNRFMQSKGSSNFLNSLTSGRLEIWKYYLSKWAEKPYTVLFGYGMFGPKLYIPNLKHSFDTHSFTVMLIYRFGIVGLILLAALIVMFVRAANKQRPKFIAYLPFIWFVIESLTDNTFQCNNIFMLVLACMILFSQCKQKNENNTQN